MILKVFLIFFIPLFLLTSCAEDCADDNRFSEGGLDCSGLENCQKTEEAITQASGTSSESMGGPWDIYAQSFALSKDQKIRFIEVFAKADTSNDEFDSLKVTLREDCDGDPCNSEVASAEVNGGALTTDFAGHKADFRPPLDLKKGHTYWFTVEFSDSNFNNESGSIETNNSNPYTKGKTKFSATQNIGPWIVLNGSRDLKFKIHTCTE